MSQAIGGFITLNIDHDLQAGPLSPLHCHCGRRLPKPRAGQRPPNLHSMLQAMASHQLHQPDNIHSLMSTKGDV